MEWLEVRIVVQNVCFSIKSRIEALDGDRQPLVNERCFAAVTGDVADSSAEVTKKLVCGLIHRAKRLHGNYYYYFLFFGPRYSIPKKEKLCYAITKYENKLEWSLLLLLIIM